MPCLHAIEAIRKRPMKSGVYLFIIRMSYIHMEMAILTMGLKTGDMRFSETASPEPYASGRL